MAEPGIGIGLGIGVGILATGFTASGVYTGVAGDVTVLTKTAQPIVFYTNDLERGRFTQIGYFKAGDAGIYPNAGNPKHEFVNSASGSENVIFTHTSATVPWGIAIQYSAAAPNNTSSFFFSGYDNVGGRIIAYSNGGIANYSANNVNLSDADEKTDITPYADADLDAFEAGFKAVDWCKFKYKDQTHDDWNHGYTAQGVETALSGAAPELVEETDLGPPVAEGAPKHKAVYDADLTHIGLALLARALKRIEALEAKVGP